MVIRVCGGLRGVDDGVYQAVILGVPSASSGFRDSIVKAVVAVAESAVLVKTVRRKGLFGHRRSPAHQALQLPSTSPQRSTPATIALSPSPRFTYLRYLAPTSPFSVVPVFSSSSLPYLPKWRQGCSKAAVLVVHGLPSSSSYC